MAALSARSGHAARARPWSRWPSCGGANVTIASSRNRRPARGPPHASSRSTRSTIPTRWLLDRVIDRVLERAGRPQASRRSLPGGRGGWHRLVAGADRARPWPRRSGWCRAPTRNGSLGSDQRWPLQEVLAVHLADTADHPDLVTLGSPHAELLNALGSIASTRRRSLRAGARSSSPDGQRDARPARALWMVNHQTLVDPRFRSCASSATRSSPRKSFPTTYRNAAVRSPASSTPR